MTEFWLISAPGEKTCQQTWDKLMASTRNNNLSTNNKFNIPDLKVGTLDVLVGLSDELAKLDSFVERGSLLTRSLADIVKREDFVLDSEYLITLLVVVPKNCTIFYNYSGFHGNVPSTTGPLVRWLKVNFSEGFIAWIHIKALRVFVESVLRYGLPVNFQAMLLQPNKKATQKKLREVLYDLYKHLDSSATGIIDVAMDIPGLNLSQQEYYPYVYYKIDCNLLDFK
ncbi:UNVERIFIED_CONTAM: hypothetical protein FKN15_002247 [Acipenser sinensis]